MKRKFLRAHQNALQILILCVESFHLSYHTSLQDLLHHHHDYDHDHDGKSALYRCSGVAPINCTCSVGQQDSSAKCFATQVSIEGTIQNRSLQFLSMKPDWIFTLQKLVLFFVRSVSTISRVHNSDLRPTKIYLQDFRRCIVSNY